MITWQLWRSLMQPWRQHPLYRRVLRSATPGIGPWLRLLAGAFIASIMVMIVLRSPASPFLNLFVLVVFAPFMVLALPLLLFVGNGLVYGLYWAWHISGLISKEIQWNRYDLLQLTPLGPFGIDWAMCLAALHRHDTLTMLHRIMRLGLRIVMTALGVVLIFISLVALSLPDDAQGWQSFERSLASLLPLAGLALFIYLEHVQSILMAVLLALISPHKMRSVLEARVWTISLFLMIYAGIYALVLLILLMVLAALRSLGIAELWHNSIIWLIAPLLAYTIRNAGISLLWRAVLRASHSNTAEISPLQQYVQEV